MGWKLREQSDATTVTIAVIGERGAVGENVAATRCAGAATTTTGTASTATVIVPRAVDRRVELLCGVQVAAPNFVRHPECGVEVSTSILAGNKSRGQLRQNDGDAPRR